MISMKKKPVRMAINSSLTDQPIFEYDSTGKITGYKTKVGADTVFPFSRELKKIGSYTGNATITTDFGTSKTIDDFVIAVTQLQIQGSSYQNGDSGGYHSINISKKYNGDTGKLSISGAEYAYSYTSSSTIRGRISYDVYVI